MRITKVTVGNYKSFDADQQTELKLAPGINVIIGENNTGKSALAEAISLRIDRKPHRSLGTHPTHFAAGAELSAVALLLHIDPKELHDLFLEHLPVFDVHNEGLDADTARQEFERITQEAPINLTVQFRPPQDYLGSRLTDFPIHAPNRSLMKYSVFPNGKYEYGGPSESPSAIRFEERIAPYIRDRIYFFQAERPKIGRNSISTERTLKQDISNLAQVLHGLSSDNKHLFGSLEALVARVIPMIRQVSVPVTDGNTTEVRIWMHDPANGREDLAIPLSECGTGVAQILAILYVIVTATVPQIFVIDEPQSFLHPRAIRHLIEIFAEHSQHQFVITTHSPTAITATDVSSIHLTTLQEGRTSVRWIDPRQVDDLRSVLLEIGARLSDVFGMDRIIWVEGPTEERCFPIIAHAHRLSIAATAILSIINTGDLETKGPKDARKAFEIYRRLSQSGGLFPPALRFILDRESRSEKQLEDINRASGGLTVFCKRRMYESYLIDTAAITRVLNKVDTDRKALYSDTEVQEWLTKNQWERQFFDSTIPLEERNEEAWLMKVHGADFLQNLFSDLSESRVSYKDRKAEFGSMLTSDICMHSPEKLKEFADILSESLYGKGP